MTLFFDKQRREEHKRQELEERSADMFQVQEHEGDLWFTYNGFLICPCTMLKDDPIEAIKEMRNLYVKRNL